MDDLGRVEIVTVLAVAANTNYDQKKNWTTLVRICFHMDNITACKSFQYCEIDQSRAGCGGIRLFHFGYNW